MNTGWEKQGICWVPKGLYKVPRHPESREWFYGRIVAKLVKGLLRAQAIELTVEGSEHVPAQGSALLAINHTGYYDFIFSGAAANLRGGRLTRFMAKKEIFDVPVVGTLVRMMKHIPVNRAAGAGALDEAIKHLQQGQLVGIFPEATISRSFEVKELKSGAVRIAQQADAPLIPVAVWGSQRVWTKGLKRDIGRSHIPVWIRIGEPVLLEGTVEEATQRLREAMIELLDGVRTEYEKAYGPFAGGESWRPASMGGSAPTVEEAERIDAEQRRIRAEKKAKKQK